MTVIERTAQEMGKTPDRVRAEIQELIDVGWQDRKIRAVWRKKLGLQVKPSPDRFAELIVAYAILKAE